MRLLIIISLIFISLVHAEEKKVEIIPVEQRPYIYISSPEIPDIFDFQSRALSKMAMMISMRTQKYQLMLGASKLNRLRGGKGKIFNLKMEGIPSKWGSKSGYNLKFSLIDPKGNVKKSVIRNKVELRHFLYRSHFLLYELFFGKDYLKKNKDEIEKEAEAEIKKIVAIAKKEVIAEQKGKKKPKMIFNEKAKLVDKEAKQTKKLIEAALNKEIPQIQKEIAEEEKKEAQKNQIATKSESHQYGVVPSDSKKIEILGRRFSKDVRYGLFTGNKSLDLKNNLAIKGDSNGYDLSVQNTFSFLGLRGELMLIDAETGIDLSMMVAKVINGGDYELGLDAEFKATYKNYALLNEKLFPLGGIEYNKSDFVTVREFGGGLDEASNTIMWARVGAGTAFKLWRGRFHATGEFGTVFVGASTLVGNNVNVTLDGTKIEGQLGYTYKNKWGADLIYKRIALTSAGVTKFSLNEDRIGLFVSYK